MILDQPEPQVEIETRIVIAQRNFSRDLGAQLSAGVVNLGRGGLGNVSTLPASGTQGGSGAAVVPGAAVVLVQVQAPALGLETQHLLPDRIRLASSVAWLVLTNRFHHLQPQRRAQLSV